MVELIIMPVEVEVVLCIQLVELAATAAAVMVVLLEELLDKMELMALAPGEVVDHRNDVRDDNRPENLRLFSSNGEHLSVTLTGRKSRASRGLPPSTRRKSAAGDRP